MISVYEPVQAKHDPRFFLVRGIVRTSNEQPERINRFLEGLSACGLSPVQSEDHGAAARSAVHTPAYLDFLETAYQQWQALPDASDEVVANIFNNPYRTTYPGGIVGRAGWHMADTACPIGEHTWVSSACASGNTAVTAAPYLLDGEKSIYALYRPHTHPDNFYPFHCGYAAETGEGDGLGCNINIPLPPLTGGEVSIRAIEGAGTKVRAFGASVLVVALGLDTSEDDPLQGMKVSTPEFESIGRIIASFDLPVLYVQEGGYLSDALAANLTSFIRGALS